MAPLAPSVLYCDPSQPNHVIFRFNDQVVDLHKSKADELLRTMTELVGDQPLTGIALVNQAQSFTLIRVLATIANAWAYSRHLTLWSDGELVDHISPHYNKAPNITPPNYAI